MSCIDCEKAQNSNAFKECYFRVGNGNVLVIACDKHLLELQQILRNQPKFNA